MNNYSVTIQGQEMGIKSLVDLSSIFSYWTNLPFFREVNIKERASKGKFSLVFVESDVSSVRYTKDTVYVYSSISLIEGGEILLYALLPFVEFQNQSDGLVTLHGASVSLRGKGVLMLGKEGAGKTSLALTLCRKYSASLVGNDLVQVMKNSKGPGVIAMSGSKYFFLRQESIRRNLPDLLRFFPDEKDSWTNKIFKQPEDLDISIEINPVPIRQVFMVHVDETKTELFTANASNLATKLYLNENLSRYIRGTSIALFDGNIDYMGYVPSMDNPQLFALRVAIIEQIVSSPQVIYIAGNIDDVARKISNYF